MTSCRNIGSTTPTMTGPESRTGDTWRRFVLALAMLGSVFTLPAAGAAAEPQDNDPREQVEERTDPLAEELGRALGMTPAEIEALGLSPEEIRSLIAGFTEETVVVGSRAQPRTAVESAVPVDVLSATDLVSQGTGDLKDQLRTIIPSFSANTQPISGVSTVVRPAMLRNLAPDHTLVLINGKRRHRSSIVDWHGGNGVAFGSQGPRHLRHPRGCVAAGRGAAGRRGGPVRVRRHRRRDELPAQGRPRRRLGRAEHRDVPGR